MRMSQSFIPTKRDNPAHAEVISHILSLKAGLIKPIDKGLYSWLPLGMKVLQKVKNIIRDEMDKAGCAEILCTAIQPAEMWKKSGRYDDYGQEMLRMKDRYDRDMLFGPTHEEVFTHLISGDVSSYKQLPIIMYQIQSKFRDEIRPRFGLMRCREFIMKDGYSFDIDAESAKNSYELMFKTYIKIFKKMGITAIPVKADTGPIGGDLSHEFHIAAESGESALYYDKTLESMDLENLSIDEMKNIYTAADEMHNEASMPIPQEQLVQRRGIEVGHIFYFGTKYSENMDASFTDKDGKLKNFHMGSYGIGVGRVVGAIIESSNDDNGIIWPEAVSPFKFGLINLHTNDSKSNELCENLYTSLNRDVLYDDRTYRNPGEKFSDMDLIGLPWQIIVGKKGAADGLLELKNRKTGEKFNLSVDEFYKKFS